MLDLYGMATEMGKAEDKLEAKKELFTDLLPEKEKTEKLSKKDNLQTEYVFAVDKDLRAMDTICTEIDSDNVGKLAEKITKDDPQAEYVFSKELCIMNAIRTGVDSTNIDKLAEANKAISNEKADDVQKLREILLEYYASRHGYMHYVIYNPVKDSKFAERKIDRYFLPEAIKEFKESTKLRCLKVRIVNSYWNSKLNNVGFVITSLNNKKLRKEMKARLSASRIRILKEYV